MEPTGNCRYCGLPITWNEYYDDTWEGGTEGFWEYHWSCVWTNTNGFFAVSEITSVFRSSPDLYGNPLRAIEQAEYLARSNTRWNGARWQVTNLETDTVIAETVPIMVLLERVPS